MALVDAWIRPEWMLPDEKEEVSIYVRGDVRSGYYRISDRWYDVADLDRWQMRTAVSWARDRAWYLRTEDVDGWRPS